MWKRLHLGGSPWADKLRRTEGKAKGHEPLCPGDAAGEPEEKQEDGPAPVPVQGETCRAQRPAQEEREGRTESYDASARAERIREPLPSFLTSEDTSIAPLSPPEFNCRAGSANRRA